MMLVLVKEVGVSTSPSIYMNYNFVETNNLVCINAYFSYNKLCVNYIGKLSSDFTSATTVYSNEQWATTRRICLLNDLYFYMYDSGQSHVYSLNDTSTVIESFDTSDFKLPNITYNIITIGNYLYFINNNSTVCRVYIIDNTELSLTYDSQITIGANNKFFRYNNQFIYNNTVINKLSILEESEKGALYVLERQGQAFRLLNKATATINDILSGKSAYINNGLVSGTMPNNGELNYQSSTSEQTIPAGYTSGGIIAASPLTDEEYDKCLKITESLLYGSQLYAYLEYITFDTNQYLNTGIPLFNCDIWEIEFKISLSDLHNYNHLITVLPNDSKFEFWVWDTGRISFRYGSLTNYDTSIYLVANTLYSIKFVQDGTGIDIYLDNELIERAERTGKTLNTLKFGYLNEANAQFRGNLYSIKFTGDNTVLLDGIPVKDVYNNIGILDKNTYKLYTSASNNSFIAGPEIVDGGEE